MLFSLQMEAQKFSGLDKSPMDAASFPTNYKDSNKAIKVIYSRPQLNGRTLDKLTPNGELWRTGANEATQITFYKDSNFGGKTVKAGTYTMATIPGEKEWTIILNSDLNTWGSYFYDQSKDVARITAPVTVGDESLEAFSIAFADDGTMYLGWDKVRVAVPTSSK
jgi:hypothetical protein